LWVIESFVERSQNIILDGVCDDHRFVQLLPFSVRAAAFQSLSSKSLLDQMRRIASDAAPKK
jgi:hypothetical protein